MLLLIAQDTEPNPGADGGRKISRGVAKERRISISDPDIVMVVRARRMPIDLCEAAQELLDQCDSISELYIDRGYLSDETIESRRLEGTQVRSTPRNPS